MTQENTHDLIEGNPVLVVIDIQGGESCGDEPSAIPLMHDYDERMQLAPTLILNKWGRS